MRQIVTVVVCVAWLCACIRITADDFFSCEPDDTTGKMAIGPTDEVAVIAVGDSLQLTAGVRPVVGGMVNLLSGECDPLYGDPVPGGTDWYTSDHRIATVSATGLVTGQAAGDAIITADAPLRSLSAALRIKVSVPAGRAR